MVIDLDNRRIEVGREKVFIVMMRPSAIVLLTAAAEQRKYMADDEKATIRRNALPLNVIDIILDYGELRRWTGDEEEADKVRKLLAEKMSMRKGNTMTATPTPCRQHC